MSGKLLKKVNWLIDVPEEDKIEDRYISSTKFSVKRDIVSIFSESHWKLSLNFNSRNTQDGISVGLFQSQDDDFRCKGMSRKGMRMKISFIILDQSDGKKEHLITTRLSRNLGKVQCMATNRWIYVTCWQVASIREKIFAKESRYVKDGQLHLSVVIQEILPPKEISKPPKMMSTDESFTAMTSKAEMVTLRTLVDGVELHAFKNLLSEGSIVFQKMFENDMEEKINGIVEIIDFSGKVMNELLRFLYMGKTELEESIVIELYNAAKVYQVGELQDICVESIETRVSDENVFEILQFADIHDEHDLYDYCLAIIFSFFTVDVIKEKITKKSCVKLQNRVLGDLISVVGKHIFCTVEVEDNAK